MDWSKHDKYPEDTCICKCGAIFRSHSKIILSPTMMLVSRRPCPKCGKIDNIRKTSSDSEKQTLGA